MDSPIYDLQVLNNHKQVFLYHKGKINFVLFASPMGNILLGHGKADGTMDCEDVLANIIAHNRVDFIKCCYPKQVAEKHPQWASKFIFPETDTVTSTTCHIIEKTVTKVDFYPCDAKSLKKQDGKWVMK